MACRRATRRPAPYRAPVDHAVRVPRCRLVREVTEENAIKVRFAGGEEVGEQMPDGCWIFSYYSAAKGKLCCKHEALSLELPVQTVGFTLSTDINVRDFGRKENGFRIHRRVSLVSMTTMRDLSSVSFTGFSVFLKVAGMSSPEQQSRRSESLEPLRIEPIAALARSFFGMVCAAVICAWHTGSDPTRHSKKDPVPVARFEQGLRLVDDSWGVDLLTRRVYRRLAEYQRPTFRVSSATSNAHSAQYEWPSSSPVPRSHPPPWLYPRALVLQRSRRTRRCPHTLGGRSCRQ